MKSFQLTFRNIARIKKMAFRNIGRNKRRSLLSGTAIAIASFVIVFLFSFMGGLINDIESNLWTYTVGAIRVRHSDFDKYERLNPMHLAIPKYGDLMAEIQSDSSVRAISPRINFPGRIPIGGIGSDRKITVMGMGVDFDLEQKYQDYERTLIEGRLPEMNTREALIGRKMAAELNAGLGDKFTILSESGSRGSNAYTFTIVGILALPLGSLEKTMVQIPLDTAQKFLWLHNQVQEILIKIDQKGDSPAEVAARLEPQLKSDVPLNVWEFTKLNGMAAYIGIAEKIYDIIAILFFLLASTVIINTTIMVIFERMKEIGTLGAMGMTGRQLVQLFFMESMFISIAGALCGITAGIILTGYLSVTGFTALSSMMENFDTAMGVGSVIYPVLNFRSIVLVFIYALAVTSLATWWPSRRAAKITPVEALRQG